ncbi:hypothetical protein [Streptomyces sp. NPDC001222]|uniref:hypothetical protein n=1 Tax=Streptomyces sp. NPDC001222 TaxID=3364548 RepID=UPI00369C5390
MSAPRPASRNRPAPRNRPTSETAAVLVRWAWFTCALVPVVLVWSGTSVAGAISATLGLTAVTWACRALLRQSELGAARPVDEECAPCGFRRSAPHSARYGVAGTGARGGGRNGDANTPVD